MSLSYKRRKKWSEYNLLAVSRSDTCDTGDRIVIFRPVVPSEFRKLIKMKSSKVMKAPVPDSVGIESTFSESSSGLRRSKRIPASVLKEIKMLELQGLVESGDEKDFEVRNTEKRGRSVFTKRKFFKNEYVLELAGDLMSYEEGVRKEDAYACERKPVNCYMTFFKYCSKSYCLDSTTETDRLGRLVNHSRTKSNLVLKARLINSKLRLLLFAKRSISEDEELLYDYGDRSAQSIKNFPWLSS